MRLKLLLGRPGARGCNRRVRPRRRRRQDRVHHKVPRSVLRDDGERREGLCRGKSRRRDHLRAGNVGHRYRGADRPDRIHGHAGASRASPLTPVDPTVAPALDKAIASGVKVVLMDNNIPDWDGRTALATTDNYNAGKIAGELSEDGAQGRRHAWVSSKACRACRRWTTGSTACSKVCRASRSRSSAAARPTARKSWASTSPRTC